jgi:hypothetical protein
VFVSHFQGGMIPKLLKAIFRVSQFFRRAGNNEVLHFLHGGCGGDSGELHGELLVLGFV